MPLVTLNLRKGRSSATRRKFADAIQASLVANLGVPNEDRYQLVREYEPDDFIHTEGYLGLHYSPQQLVMIEIAFIEGRSDGIKRALLRDINERLCGDRGDRSRRCVHCHP